VSLKLGIGHSCGTPLFEYIEVFYNRTGSHSYLNQPPEEHAVYESRHQAPLSRAQFVQRLLVHALMAMGLIAGSLTIGMLGYMFFEHLSWIDAFLNSSMLLGGMGPVNMPQTAAGKLFAGLYALYAGLAFIVTVALLFTPLLHRLLHRFHWDEKA
jgi:hypothetical protein